MNVLYEINEICRQVKDRDFKQAANTLQNIEEKAFTTRGVIEPFLREGFKSTSVFKSFTILDQTPEAENFKFCFCSFLTEIALHNETCLKEYYLDLLEISFSGFICSKSAKLKEAWLRLFKRVITYSTSDLEKFTVLEIYVKKLFDQLASKQAQTVTGVLCSTLAAVISHTPTIDLRDRLLSFLTKLLAEKLSYSTKRAEFVIISAVSSSISKLLRSAYIRPKHEDVDKFFGYSLQILLADLDKISQYKSIKSACKLLSASCKYISSCDSSRAQAVIVYLQNLTNHKNSSLASTSRRAYIDLLKFVSKSVSFSDDEIKSILNRVIPFLMDNSVLETLPTKLFSFRLKGLSILLPLYVKNSSNHDSTQILALTVQKLNRLASQISNNPWPPVAYCLTDLLDALLYLFTKASDMLSARMKESLLVSVKLGIISCFQAYPRLSQASTEPLARVISKIIKKTASDKDALAILDEAFYRIVLQTCSHSPFDLDVSESDGDDSNEVEKDTEEDSFEKIRQPNAFTQPDVAIPLPSFSEYLPLWRYLLGLPSGIRKEDNHKLVPKQCSALVLHFLLNSAMAIVKRLDFSYEEVSADTTEMETQVDVKAPHDILILSNIAAFLERILPDCTIENVKETLPPFLLMCLQFVERYPLLSGLYRLLKLTILLAKRSGFFQSNEFAFGIRLQPFAHFLIDSFPPMGALSADDLNLARSSCLLSLPLSVLGRSNINQIGHITASISQLITFQGRCASLAIETASAIEAWLKETKADPSFYPTAFSALVPALVNLLNGNPDEPRAIKSALPLIGRRSHHSYARTELRRALKAISKRPTILKSDSLIREAQDEVSEEICDKFVEILPTGKGVFSDLSLYLPFPDITPYIHLSDLRLFTRVLFILLWRPKSSENSNNKGFSRQMRVCAAEYIHEYILFGLNNKLAASNDPTEPIENTDASYWQLLFQVTFILGADDDPLIRRLFSSLAFQVVHWYAGYPMAGLCEAKLLQKTIFRILKLMPPEDDIFGIIESTWPIPVSIDALRTKLASVCLRDFLNWMNSKSPGTKRRRSSLGDENLDDLLRQILEGLCREDSASVVFTDVLAPLLAERPELTRKYIYVLIDAFKRQGRNCSPTVLKRAIDLIISLIKQSPEDLAFEECSNGSKRPRLTRVAQSKRNVDSLKPLTWESASIASCVKSFLAECRDSPNRKLFQELIEQVLFAANLQIIPQILLDSESIVSMLECDTDNPEGFINCLDNYSWLLSSNLLSSSEFIEVIHIPNCSVIAKLKEYCSSPESLKSGGTGTILNFLLSLLRSKPRIELSSIFFESHSMWSFLALCLLNPAKAEIQSDESIAISMLKFLSKNDIIFVKGSISRFLQSEGFSSNLLNAGSNWINEDNTAILFSISLLINNVKGDIGFQDLLSCYINKNMCQDILNTLKEELPIQPDVTSKLIQSVFTISAFFKYQITFDKEIILKLINPCNKCLIHPSALLSILGLNQENDTPLESPNIVVSTLLKFLANYSREPNKLRTNQLCEGITGVWKRHIEPLLRFKDFDSGLLVDLLEAIISLSQGELDRNAFISTFLYLLKDETLNVSAKVKNLDMLAFFLQSDITPTNFNLSIERRDEIVEAVKYLLASNLPLDPHEIISSPVKLAECSTILKSISSLLKALSCPEAIRMLMMTFCRYEDYLMDEELEESLRIAMKRIWTRPLTQEQVLTSALNYFEQAVSSANPSSAFISLWHRYIHKFLKPLLLSVSPSALERLAVRNIAKWIQMLEVNPLGDGVNVAQWLWRLLSRCLIFFLLVTVYNRLPKSVLHGLTAGGVGSVLRAFLGPSKLDLIQSGQIKGNELTAAIIKKACSSLQDQLNPPFNTPLTEEFESTAKTLKRTVWSASLACLVAALNATQTQEKAYSYILISDPLSRFLPDTSFTFPRCRSGKYRSAFIELKEQFWLPSEREPHFGKINVESQGIDSSSRQRSKSGGLLFGSSLSVEINRFMRPSGTQIIRGSTASTDFRKPLSPRVSPLTSTTSSDFRQVEDVEAEPNYVNLEVDPLNMTSLMITFVGLLKHMSQLGLLKPNDMPQVIKFLYDQFNSNRLNDNVRAFVVKLVVNCPDVFKPFSKHWFPLLLTYESSSTEALLDSSGLSSLSIDICLLLADWSHSNILPMTEMEKTAAQGVLAFLIKHAWVRASEDGEPHIPEGIAPALKRNLELIQLLVESWLPAGVQIPYRDLLTELQSRVDGKRTIFTLHLFKTILIASQRFTPEGDNLPLSPFVSTLLQHLHQTQKTLLIAAWECSSLLASKCFIAQPFTTSLGGFLRSRALNILPLSTFPKDLHPLINELWSIVAEFNTVHHRKRPSDTPITSVIEAACAAAFHWSVLALHLTNSLLGTGIPENIEPNSFVHCLRVFTKLFEDLNENRLGFALEQTAKIEVLQSMVNSNIFEIIKSGNAEILSYGTMLILRMVQFVKSIPQDNREFDMETRNGLVLRILQFLLSTLTRPNSTPNSRRIAYRVFIESRRNEKSSENREIKNIYNLGLSYGLCAEDDDQLRRQLRKYVSGHCFDSLPIPGLSSSLSRCLQTFQLLSSGHFSSTDDLILMNSVGRHLISTSLEIVLEPAIKSAGFRHPFRHTPLDPHYPFTDAGFSRTSVSISQSLLDPVVLSGTQQLKRSQTQFLETALESATLALPGGDSTQTQLLETQQMPSNSVFTQFGETSSDKSGHRQMFFPVKFQRRVKKIDFKNLSPVEQLRRKFSFAATLAAQNPVITSHSEDSIREFFKRRTIQRQHAETSTANSSLSLAENETSTRLCRRHRIGALPDVEKLTPEALLKPLFQLAKSDSTICGPALLRILLESIVVSSGMGVDDNFVKGLGASLAGLLIRGGINQSIICLSLIWELGLSLQRERIILSMIPEPTILTACAISSEKPVIGVSIMEEALCNLATMITPHESSSLSPWTSKRRRFYASSMPIFILPQEEIEVVCIESDRTPSKTTAATFWWQLTRLYSSIGRSEEILGWLCDRWTSGADSNLLLKRLGTAIVAKGFGDYEGAASQLKEILITSTDENESELGESSGMEIEESDVSKLWTTESSRLNTELRLVCREEVLHCLGRLGSWEDLDIYAMDSAKYLGACQADESLTGLNEASTSNMFDKESASLWKEPYLADSILPQVIHARLQLCLSSEINSALSNQLQGPTSELSNFARLMDSGLLTSQDFGPKYAYELALLSILREDLSKAQFCCKEAFKHLAQTWSSKGDNENCLERVQLITELKEYLEVASSELDSDAASKLLASWQDRCSMTKCSEEIINSRLFYLSKLRASGNLSLEEEFLPACIDFRLKCCCDFTLRGNAKRAINRLSHLHQLIRKIDNDDHYRRLAWCNAFSRAWMTEYLKSMVYLFEEEKSSSEVENGLGQCLSSLSQCIDAYDFLKMPTLAEEVDLNVVQFSHAISIAQVLSAFHDLSVSGRLSNGASKRLTSSLQPTLKSRFVKIPGLEEVDKADNFLRASAFAFFKRCVDLAFGIQNAEGKGDRESVSAERTLCRRNLIVWKPDEALLEVANFCNARINEETASRDTYMETFSRSVLTAMRMGSEGGRIRFGRVLQLEVARCSTSPSTYDAALFHDLTKDIPPWMFSQWFDRLLTAPLEGGPFLVEDILRRIAAKFPQALSLPFRVLLTSFCDWNFVQQSSFEHFMAKLMKEGRSETAVFYSEIHDAFSKLMNLNNFLRQLEYFDEPDLVFRDWANSYAKKAIQSSNFNPTDLVNSCNALLNGGFLRMTLKSETASEVGNPEAGRRMAVAHLAKLIHNEFGRDCKGLLTISPAEFEMAVKRIHSTHKEINQNYSKLLNYSHWLASYSSGEGDCVEMPGQRLESSSDTKRLITIERIDPNVKVLPSLRRPKLIRLLGSDGRWSGWLVKGGEDLRQDSNIQRLLGFANHAISSDVNLSESNTPVTPLRTYVVIPVSSQRGLIQWLDGTTTLSSFCRNAMTDKEMERFEGEVNALDAEISRHQDDLLWGIEMESIASSVVSRFTAMESFVYSLRLIRRGLFKSIATSAEHFASLRYRLISSHASLSALYFILGVGDRHLGNFLLDRSSGSLIGIDFGYVFGVCLSFPSPEYVPIRLTSSLRELHEPAGPAGLFGSTLSRTLASLRHNSSLFLSSLQTFIEDKSTTDWSVFSVRYNQSEEEYQRSRLSMIRRKLIGHCPAEILIDDLRALFGSPEWFSRFEMIVESSIADDATKLNGVLPPIEQTRRLVCLSTCPELLARMHSGWSAAM